MKYDVVIVGGGIVGLSLALGLNQNGLQVSVIESRSTGSTDVLIDNRVETRIFAINHTSKRLMQNLDVWNSIELNRISPYYQIKVWDDSPHKNINITAEEIAEHSLGCIVENDVMIQALLDKISDKGIDIYENKQIQKIEKNGDIEKIILTDKFMSTLTPLRNYGIEWSSESTLHQKVIKTSLIVGADGANSFIRDYFNFSTKIKPYKHKAIVATLDVEKPHKQIAYQRFYEKGVLALLPLENENRISIVWSVKPEYADFLINLQEQQFENKLSQAINNVLGDVKLLSKRFSFELVQRHAESYIKDNVVLVGDAAHTIHPLAGQGINIGLKDVKVLVKVLSDAFLKGRILGHLSTLDKYQRARKLDNKKMIALMKAFKEVFANNNSYVKKARRAGFKFIDKNSFVKSLVVKQVF